MAIAQETTLSLSRFLESVEKESPDLAVEKANVEAADARASGVRIPPPMIGLMQMKEGGATRTGIEISQEVPFPTKINQDKKVRTHERDAQKESSQYQKTLVLAEARKAYVEFWVAFERLSIMKEKRDWLRHHVKLTRSATRSDSSAQIHLLEVESDADLIENDLLALEADVTEKKSGLTIYAPTLKVASLLPEAPPVPTIVVANLSESPLIAWRRKELASREAQEGLARQAYAPDIFLRFRTLNGNEAAPESQELMIGVSVPFFYFWQPKAEKAQATAEKLKAAAQLQRATIEFGSRLASLTAKANSINAQLKNLDEKLIPRAEKRKKLVTTLSQRTMEGLDEHRSVMVGYLDLRAKSLDLRLDLENTFTEILKLTGLEQVPERVGAR